MFVDEIAIFHMDFLWFQRFNPISHGAPGGHEARRCRDRRHRRRLRPGRRHGAALHGERGEGGRAGHEQGTGGHQGLGMALGWGLWVLWDLWDLWARNSSYKSVYNSITP